MGWTVYYEAGLSQPFSDDQQKKTNEILDKWNKKINPGSEFVFLEFADEGKVWGFTKVHFSEAPVQDFRTVLYALKEIEEQFPEIKFAISDDYYYQDESLESLGPIEELLKEEEMS